MTTKNSSPPIPKHLYSRHLYCHRGKMKKKRESRTHHPSILHREHHTTSPETPKSPEKKTTMRGTRLYWLALSLAATYSPKKKHHKTMRTWPKHRASKGMTTGKTVLCFPSHVPCPKRVHRREPRHARRSPTSRVYSSPVQYRPPRWTRQPAPTKYRPLKSPPSTASRSLPGEPGSRCRPRP